MVPIECIGPGIHFYAAQLTLRPRLALTEDDAERLVAHMP